jgi:hypothetical protein
MMQPFLVANAGGCLSALRALGFVYTPHRKTIDARQELPGLKTNEEIVALVIDTYWKLHKRYDGRITSILTFDSVSLCPDLTVNLNGDVVGVGAVSDLLNIHIKDPVDESPIADMGSQVILVVLTPVGAVSLPVGTVYYWNKGGGSGLLSYQVTEVEFSLKASYIE